MFFLTPKPKAPLKAVRKTRLPGKRVIGIFAFLRCEHIDHRFHRRAFRRRRQSFDPIFWNVLTFGENMFNGPDEFISFISFPKVSMDLLCRILIFIIAEKESCAVCVCLINRPSSLALKVASSEELATIISSILSVTALFFNPLIAAITFMNNLFRFLVFGKSVSVVR